MSELQKLIEENKHLNSVIGFVTDARDSYCEFYEKVLSLMGYASETIPCNQVDEEVYEKIVELQSEIARLTERVRELEDALKTIMSLDNSNHSEIIHAYGIAKNALATRENLPLPTLPEVEG